MLRSKYISGIALYYLAAALALTLFFELWRLVLLVVLRENAASVPTSVLCGSFLVGWRFDFAVSSYITLPLYLIAVIPMIEISRRPWMRAVNFTLLAVTVGVVFLIHLIDIEFFRYFNARVNGTVLLWRDTPGFATSMVWGMYPVVRYLIMYGVILALFLLLIRTLGRKLIVERVGSPVWVNLLYLPVVVAIFVVGARGRIEEKSPLRWGVAYFSKYDFANQLALNPNYTFFHDAVYNAGSAAEVERLMEEINTDDAERVTRRLLGLEEDSTVGPYGRIVRPVRFEPQNDNPPNVIVIIMESFGSTRIGALDNRWPYDLSPCFDSAAERGILFTNFYSNGMHTYTGLFCTLYGYPHLIGKMIMKQVIGHSRFWGLPSILKRHGYETIFFTTHDPHFDNMQGFLKANGVDRVCSLFDYDKEEKLSTLGVPDHVMFDRAVVELRRLRGKRFFATLLTGSNHGPWIIPDVPFEPVPKTERKHKRLNAFKYSDWALGRFLAQIEDDPAFANTLVVVTADNGTPHNTKTDLDLTQFQIPLLILNTDWDRTDAGRIDRLGSQMDILSTVMGLVGLDYDDYSFGHDLLRTNGKIAFVHLSEWYKIGYVEDEYYHISRIRGPESLFGLDDPGKDLCDSLQALCRDYEKRVLSLFATAYYNMSRPLADRK